MGGGGGGDFFERAIDVVTQVSTGGLAGFEDGDFGKGVQLDEVPGTLKSVVKDITGATAAEEATAQARERFNEEKAAALAQRKEAKALTAKQQLTASRLAAGARRAGATTAAGTKTKSTKLGSDESDFLGL